MQDYNANLDVNTGPISECCEDGTSRQAGVDMSDFDLTSRMMWDAAQREADKAPAAATKVRSTAVDGADSGPLSKRLRQWWPDDDRHAASHLPDADVPAALVAWALNTRWPWTETPPRSRRDRRRDGWRAVDQGRGWNESACACHGAVDHSTTHQG